MTRRFNRFTSDNSYVKIVVTIVYKTGVYLAERETPDTSLKRDERGGN